MGSAWSSPGPLYPQLLKKLMAVLCLWLLLASTIHAETSANLSSLTFITEEYPPYNYVNNQQIKRFSVELLEAIFAATNTPLSRQDIRLYPWVRGYELAMSQPNTVLFSTTQTAARETSFQWVGPITQDRVALLAYATLR